MIKDYNNKKLNNLFLILIYGRTWGLVQSQSPILYENLMIILNNFYFIT